MDFIGEDFLYASAIALGTLALLELSRRPDHVAADQQHQLVAVYGPVYRAVFGVLLCAGFIGIYVFFFKAPYNSLWVPILASSILCSACLGYFYHACTYRIIVTASGIRVQEFLSGNRFIAWGDITHIKYGKVARALTIQDSVRSVTINRFVDGTDRLKACFPAALIQRYEAEISQL
jgi:hypothetical protein